MKSFFKKLAFVMALAMVVSLAAPAAQASAAEKKEFTYAYWGRVDETHSSVRFCTSWATKQEDVALLCAAIRAL